MTRSASRDEPPPLELTGNSWFDSLPELLPDDPVYSMPPTIVFGRRLTYSDDRAGEPPIGRPPEER